MVGDVLSAKQAWLILFAAICLYEALCREGELLSEQCDRWLVSRPVSTRFVVAVVALHLVNLLPSWGDPLLMLAGVSRRGSRFAGWCFRRFHTRSGWGFV